VLVAFTRRIEGAGGYCERALGGLLAVFVPEESFLDVQADVQAFERLSSTNGNADERGLRVAERLVSNAGWTTLPTDRPPSSTLPIDRSVDRERSQSRRGTLLGTHSTAGAMRW
jgi:hypothetical protein